MAQNITIAGNQYPSVPSIQIPKTGTQGNAVFVDPTVVTAEAEDVKSGKYFIDANGDLVEGQSAGGGIVQIYQDQDGYVVLDDEGSNVTTVTPLNVTENGTYGTLGGSVAYQPVVVNVSGGGGGQTGKDVVFLDYDGTEVASYDIADMTALPSNPSHTGLTAQGWNWTLQQITAYNTAYPDQTIYVGQMYTTDTGDTRLYIHIDEDTPDNRLTFYVRFTSSTSNNVTIDWGDGVTETQGSTTATNYPHTYSTSGDYVIKLTVNSGTISFVGTSGTSGNSIFGSRGNANAYNRGRIRKVEIGDNVTTLGTYALYNCYSLTSITIPSSVTSIEGSAFYYCYSLTSITIPSGVTGIFGSTFYYCHSLDSIAISGGITSLGNSAFYNCYSLTSITIPSSVTSIAGSLFSGCYSLTSITIPSGVSSIGDGVFNNCYSLTNITIPSSITSIGNSAFYNCFSLTSITIPSGVTSIGNYAFQYCYALTSITIPSSVTSIGIQAFQNCFSLTNITIPSGVTSIGNGAFNQCFSLASIAIPSGVTSIGTQVFYNCYSLASIAIPSGVTSIGTQAFQYCYGIGEYHFEPTTPPTITNTNVFNGIQPDCKIYVPYSADHSVLNAYQTADYWSTYASYMVEESA